MFTRKLSLVSESSKDSLAVDNSTGSHSAQGPADERDTAKDGLATPPQAQELDISSPPKKSSKQSVGLSKSQAAKRPATEVSSSKTSKRSKPTSTQVPAPSVGKGQRSLKGFFNPKSPTLGGSKTGSATDTIGLAVPSEDAASSGGSPNSPLYQARTTAIEPTNPPSKQYGESSAGGRADSEEQGDGAADEETEIHDPIVAMESWSRIFSKRHPPKCEGHDEHCIQLTTKKPGANCGRAFWICPRPVGPSGVKENGTEWRCNTFIWGSDWNGAGS